MLQPQNFYEVGSLRHKNNNLQLILRLPLTLANGETREIKALIDTGAEANLIRMGLLPSHLFFQSQNPLSLIAANGQRLGGGERIIPTVLGFVAQQNGEIQPELMVFPADFHEAEIQVDAIISYPWMVDHQIGVFPHKRALAIDQPILTLLFGLSNSKNKKGKKIRQNKWINQHKKT